MDRLENTSAPAKPTLLLERTKRRMIGKAVWWLVRADLSLAY